MGYESSGVGKDAKPKIYILSSALGFISLEVRRCEDSLETGGLLLGTKQADGSRIITHALPSGPAAIRHAVMFERDLRFSQAALDHFAKSARVEYVGEWHKHPSNLTQPSSGDREGVRRILSDPDYQTGGVMVFPIFVVERDSTSMQRRTYGKVSGTSILEFDCRDDPSGVVRCYPYLMRNDSDEFEKCEFVVVDCDLESQARVKEFSDEYVLSVARGDLGQEERGNRTHRKEVVEDAPSREKLAGSSSDPSRNSVNSRSDSSRASSHPPARGASQSSSGESRTNWESETHVSKARTEDPELWYETRQGKERLAWELEGARRPGIGFVETRVLDDGRLSFRFGPISEKIEYLDVLCKVNHPHSPPELIVKCGRVVLLPNHDDVILGRLSRVRQRIIDEWKTEQVAAVTIADEIRKAASSGPGGSSRQLSPGNEQRSPTIQSRWYETESGKVRLSQEIGLLEPLFQNVETRMFQDGRLAIQIQVRKPAYDKQKMLIVFPDDFPKDIPMVLLEHEGGWTILKPGKTRTASGESLHVAKILSHLPE